MILDRVLLNMSLFRVVAYPIWVFIVSAFALFN
eukprot:g3195.t1